MLTRPTTRSLLALLMACPLAAADASTVTHDAEPDTCHRTSCSSTSPGHKNADFVFVRSMTTDDHRKQPEKHRDGHGRSRKDKDWHHGPDLIPPGGRPEVIHTGSGKDIFPGPVASGHCPVPTTTVPVPAAAWLLISGIAGLGLGAGRRKRS